MTYQVTYRLPGQWFWRRLKRVKGDGIMPENPQIRFFILEDETRVEIPSHAVFVFSSARCTQIKQRMERESGGQTRLTLNP